jgi:hypothetical protein
MFFYHSTLVVVVVVVVVVVGGSSKTGANGVCVGCERRQRHCVGDQVCLDARRAWRHCWSSCCTFWFFLFLMGFFLVAKIVSLNFRRCARLNRVRLRLVAFPAMR